LPGPQTAAAESEADEVLYGGAAGGGKTYLQIERGINAHRQSIIFRREATQATEIADTLDDLLADWSVSINHNTGRWTMPDGRFVEIGSMPGPENWRRYKGRPHDFIGFDELSEFTRKQYRMSILWCRTTHPGQRTRVIAGTNPPTSEAERWIIEEWAPWLDPKFPDPAAPGELRFYTYDGDRLVWFKTGDPVDIEGRTIRPKSRTFIPAFLDDNPYLVGTDYERQLLALPEDLRRIFLDGSFTAATIDDPLTVIPSAWIHAAMDRRPPTGDDRHPITSIGVDPARGGPDETVICIRRGYAVDDSELLAYEGTSTPDGPSVASLVLRYCAPGVPVIVDVIGIGSSVVDSLKANGINVVAFNSAAATKKTDKTGRLRFANKRAEAYWRLRELLDPSSGFDLYLPDDAHLAAELAAPKFKVTPRGIQIEPKDAIKERLGRSPDRADAVVYSFVEAPVLFAIV